MSYVIKAILNKLYTIHYYPLDRNKKTLHAATRHGRKPGAIPSAFLSGFFFLLSFTVTLHSGYSFFDKLPQLIGSSAIPLEAQVGDIMPIDHQAGADTAMLTADALLPEHLQASNADARNPWKTIQVQPGDNLSRIFARLGLPSNELEAILDLGGHTKSLLSLYPGQRLQFLIEAQQLKSLVYAMNETDTLTITDNNAGGYTANIDARPLDTRVAYSSGRVKGSLFASAQRAGLNTQIILAMADIFAWDIDFALDIQPGDAFRVLYEQKWLDNELIKTGAILAAEFTNSGHVYRAVRYTNEDGHSAYYTPDGHSLRKAFLRTPVNFSRISSHFSTGRKHPILHRIRAHKGVDYAAARGTPVHASGNAKIIKLGRRNGYGNTIELQHGDRYTTLYAHLNGFAKSLKVGQKVKQGQIIGYVGSTGLATGPHLHYEFRVDGQHRNPLTVALPTADPINRSQKKRFLAATQPLLIQLQNHHNNTEVALIEEE